MGEISCYAISTTTKYNTISSTFRRILATIVVYIFIFFYKSPPISSPVC